MTRLEIAPLTPQESLDLIGDLWDSLTPADVALTPAQYAEFARRIETFDKDMKRAVAWDGGGGICRRGVPHEGISRVCRDGR